jgi:hypothetical protein
MVRPSFVIATAFILAGPVPAADPPRVVRENVEWLDVWVPGNNAPNLPKVLLVGDSITRAYFKVVEEKLKGQATVCRLATSKSLGDPGLLDEVKLVFGQAKFAVIHVNNGMHGWGYTEEEYAKGLPDLLAVVRAGAPKAKLVWATTTPVRVAGKADQLDPKTDRVKARNATVAALMAKEQIPVNDLFAAVVDKSELYSPDGVHLTAKGSVVLGEQVADHVVKALRGTR